MVRTNTTAAGHECCTVTLNEVAVVLGVTTDWVREMAAKANIGFAELVDWAARPAVSTVAAAELVAGLRAWQQRHDELNRAHQRRVAEVRAEQQAAAVEAKAKAAADWQEQKRRIAEKNQAAAAMRAAAAAAEAERQRVEQQGRPPSFDEFSKDYEKGKVG